MAQSSPQEIVISSIKSPGTYLEVDPHSCPRFKVSGGFLLSNSDIASGCHELGHQPIPFIPDGLEVIFFIDGLPGVEK